MKHQIDLEQQLLPPVGGVSSSPWGQPKAALVTGLVTLWGYSPRVSSFQIRYGIRSWKKERWKV